MLKHADTPTAYREKMPCSFLTTYRSHTHTLQSDKLIYRVQTRSAVCVICYHCTCKSETSISDESTCSVWFCTHFVDLMNIQRVKFNAVVIPIYNRTVCVQNRIKVEWQPYWISNTPFYQKVRAKQHLKQCWFQPTERHHKSKAFWECHIRGQKQRPIQRYVPKSFKKGKINHLTDRKHISTELTLSLWFMLATSETQYVPSYHNSCDSR